MIVVDTNILLQNPNQLDKFENIVLLSPVLEEIDKHKSSLNNQLAFESRRAIRKIKELEDKVKFDIAEEVKIDGLDKHYADNKIIQYCLDNNYKLITNDISMKYKARSYGIEIVEVDEATNDDSYRSYTGVKDVYFDKSVESQELLAHIYQSPEDNIYDLATNEYICFWDKASPTYDADNKIKGYEPIDQFRFDGEKLVKLKYKNIDNGYMGKIKPINVKQKLFFDMLQNKDVTVKSAFGGFGVGKDYIMITHAVNLLLQGKIEKIVWVRNNVEVKDSNPIGFLPNGLTDKLKPYAMILADHLGGEDGLDGFLNDKKIEIQHLGYMRGRDLKNCIVYCSEIQSATTEHVQLLLGRIGENSQLWLNGDLKQVDDNKFQYNNGVNALKKLKGQQLYGQVTLDKIERSKTAMLSELLD